MAKKKKKKAKAAKAKAKKAPKKKKKAKAKKATKAKVKKPRVVPPPTSGSREDRMRHMREAGMTFEAIASAFGMTRQRVHQLITEAREADENPEEKEPHAHLLRGRGSQRKQEQLENP